VKDTATLSFALCNNSDNADGSVVLAKWWPMDEDFMYDKTLYRTVHVRDCTSAVSSAYKIKMGTDR